MIINNTHVQGMYKYSDSLEFELGDFVVKNNCIYICTAKYPTNEITSTVSGQNPDEHPENFDIYLANKVASLEDYINYINGNSTEDKFISNYTLSSILQRQFFGLDDSGLVVDSILYDSNATLDENKIIYSSRLESALSYLDADSNVLDRILNAPTLNNGVVKISPTLPEVEEVFLKTLKLKENYDEENNFIILRQYTYDNTTENYTSPIDLTKSYRRYRVQELVNPLTGSTYCRYSVGEKSADIIDPITKENLWTFRNSSNWRSLLETQYKEEDAYNTRLTEISNYYQSRLSSYENKLNSLKSLYRTAIITSINNIVTASVTFPLSDVGIENINTFNRAMPVQVLIGTINDGISKLFTTTVDIMEAKDSDRFYYVSNEVSLNVIISNDLEKTVTISINGGVSNYYIKEISYKKIYG